jgi:SRSO17 transposase
MYAVPGLKRNADIIYWPTGMRMYVPEDWFEYMERCKEAGIPKNVKFQTKPEIALDLIDKVLKENVPHCAIIGDTFYGTDGGFRKTLREWKEPYVLAVKSTHISVVPEDTTIIQPPEKNVGRGRPQIHHNFPKTIHPKTADQVAKELSENNWKTVEWSEGTKGKLSAKFYRMRVRVSNSGRPTEETGWLLFEKKKRRELKVYICWGLDDAPLEKLVEIAHTRWVIEQGFKQMKGDLGLDDFEGRKWQGWHHHASMVMIAFCYLMLLRIKGVSSGEKLPTLPRVRKEIVRLFIRKGFEHKFKLSPAEADEALEDMPWLIPD